MILSRIIMTLAADQEQHLGLNICEGAAEQVRDMFKTYLNQGQRVPR